MYHWLKPLLLRLPPEMAHTITLKSLQWAPQSLVTAGFGQHDQKISNTATELWGLSFPNPVGLAAGLDKNADYVEGLAQLGFGFIEVGTVTPRSQNGNPKPRLFRLTQQQALINRMGFNNKGVDYLIRRLEQTRYSGILGINIGKNKDTPPEKSLDDYSLCITKVYPYADYITINVSSPNTPGLRALQQADELSRLLDTLLSQREQLSVQHRKQVPLVLKIAPDLDEHGLDDLAATVLQHRIDGLIVSNTTISRPGVEQEPLAQTMGGLSGKPLLTLSTQILQAMHQRLNGAIPLIGTGGICCGNDAVAKISAGADLVQIYTGLIYHGPDLIAECIAAMSPQAD